MGLCNAPKFEYGEYNPLTPCRMGYFYVFDTNDENSLQEAKHEYEAQEQYLENKQLAWKPVVFFVGTKGDKAPGSEPYKQVTKNAKEWTDTKEIPLKIVSAFKREKV